MRITIPARRPVRRRSRGPGWATILLLTVSALAAPPALGAPAADAPAAADGSDDRAASTAVSAPTSFGKEATPVSDDEAASSPDEYSAPDEDVLAYWTPERLAAATPLDAPEPSDADAQQGATSTQPTGPEEVSEPAAPSAEAVAKLADELDSVGTALTEGDEQQDAPVAAPPETSYSATNGKLFFRDANGIDTHTCSASAQNTESKRLILTAAHCVYNFDTGKWSENAVFVPAFDGRNNDDREPFGMWTARSFRTFDTWIDEQDWTHDVGYVTLNDGGDNDEPIVNTVGGHGMKWNGPSAFDVSIFGYPSNKKDPDGRLAMWTCQENAARDASKESSYSITGCDFGKGSSGGPSLDSYDNSTGLGYLESVMSRWNDAEDENWGPYFSGDMKTARDAATRYD